MMTSEQLQQAVSIQTKCGRRVIPPAGLEFLDLAKSYLYQVTTSGLSQVSGYRDITGDAPFLCRAISGIQDTATWYRVQWPDGKYLSNSLMNLTPVCWAGSFKRALTREVLCPAGSRILITTNNVIPNNGSLTNVALLFEGVSRYAIEKATGKIWALTADQSRYYANPNMNILAPEMDLDLDGSGVPQGFRQVEYRQTSELLTYEIGGGLQLPVMFSGTIIIPSSSAFDYQLRRLEFELAGPSGSTVTALVQPRDSSGFSLSSDFVPTYLIQNSPLPKYWCIPAGTDMIFDFSVSVANPVAGPVTVQVITVGMKQFRKAAA
jgi:hypothetical protein